jgi:excisionase family DNA binding protein
MLAMQETYFTPEQVAKMLQVSTDTILRLIRRKQLKATKIGAQYRISKSDLETHIEEQKNK